MNGGRGLEGRGREPTLAERRSSQTQRCKAAGPKAGDRENGVGRGAWSDTQWAGRSPGLHWSVWLTPKNQGYGAARPNLGDKENGEGECPVFGMGLGRGLVSSRRAVVS